MALTLLLPLVLLVSACSSDDGSAEESADAAVVLSRAGSATRSSSPFGFVQLLRTELSDGKSLQQRTVGVYDGVNDRASIEVTSEGDTEGVFTASTTIDLGSKLSVCWR